MTGSHKEEPTLTIEQARALADDLIRELVQHHGDDDAVCRIMRRWLAELDSWPMSMVALAAMRTVFADCLTPVTVDAFPAGGLTITAPPKGDAA